MMWPFSRGRQQYEVVADDEEELNPIGSSSPVQIKRRPSRRPLWYLLLSLGAIAIVALGAHALGVGRSRLQGVDDAMTSGTEFDLKEPSPSATPSSCTKRREWRTVPAHEQQVYIDAVLCLRTQPSILSPDSNRTVYDDFPWIHSHVGYYTHNSAPFLPWHRYFLHIYEATLRDRCNYSGGLMYWDWTLDSDALERSPVFDPKTGFGGDGEVGGETSIGRSGRCLVDGPFAGVTADYYDVKYDPHCLSRGFRDLDGTLGHIEGHDISPESIEEVLSLGDYEQFVALMESRVHDAIPFGIGGDFETFTAPYGRFI